MKEKIYSYISEKNRPVSTQEIIEQFFHVFGTAPRQIVAIVAAMLSNDSRFFQDKNGDWMVIKKQEPEDLKALTFSIIDIEQLQIDSKIKVPFTRSR